MLRSQELPSEAEFDAASTRAAGIFRIQRQPVRTARSVHALADAIRRNAGGRLEAAKNLDAELAGHAATLGLTETADRQITSRLLTALLGRLAATTDDTQTVRVLAAAELPKENAFYYAHLDSAERLTPALRQVNWQVLDDARGQRRRGRGGDRHRLGAAPGRPPRRARDRAGCAAAQGKRGRDRLVPGSRAKKPEPAPTPAPPVRLPGRCDACRRSRLRTDPAPSSPALPPGDRVRAKDVPAFVEQICEAADEHPDAEFEITWRIVER